MRLKKTKTIIVGLATFTCLSSAASYANFSNASNNTNYQDKVVIKDARGDSSYGNDVAPNRNLDIRSLEYNQNRNGALVVKFKTSNEARNNKKLFSVLDVSVYSPDQKQQTDFYYDRKQKQIFRIDVTNPKNGAKNTIKVDAKFRSNPKAGEYTYVIPKRYLDHPRHKMDHPDKVTVKGYAYLQEKRFGGGLVSSDTTKRGPELKIAQ